MKYDQFLYMSVLVTNYMYSVFRSERRWKYQIGTKGGISINLLKLRNVNGGIQTYINTQMPYLESLKSVIYRHKCYKRALTSAPEAREKVDLLHALYAHALLPARCPGNPGRGTHMLVRPPLAEAW